MQRRSVDALVRALNDAGVRYLIVGGLAVVAHGYVRFTADVDIVFDFVEGNLRAAVTALGALGYRPRAPVALEDFLDPAQRANWSHDKGLTVFSLHSPQHPATEIDVFVEAPFDFVDAYARRVALEVGAGITATFIGLDDLLDMKKRAGRAQDLLDIQRLIDVRRGSDES